VTLRALNAIAKNLRDRGRDMEARRKGFNGREIEHGKREKGGTMKEN